MEMRKKMLKEGGTGVGNLGGRCTGRIVYLLAQLVFVRSGN